jgi:ribosomal protein S18 acetylase RimI-like enzyme
MTAEIKRINSSESSLVIDLFNKYRVFYNQPSNIDLARNFIQARLDKDESVIFVATIKDKSAVIPIGFTQLYPKFSSGRAIKIWVLNDLYVEQEHRKQGIGESLINVALKYVKEDRASHVELSTAVDNYAAQSLYESIGFKRQNPGTDFLDYRIDIAEISKIETAHKIIL